MPRRTACEAVREASKRHIGERAAQFAKRHLLWLLVGCYALAICWPTPGRILRGWQWSPAGVPEPVLSLPLALLALMLFSAALATDLAHLRGVLQRPVLFCAALVAVWVGPGLLVIAAGFLVPATLGGQATTGLLVGLTLIATMPVANSSVGWTQHADGDLALSLALVVLSISLSPLVTPHLLGWLGMSLSPREQAYFVVLVNRFSGLFFVSWVVLPTAIGAACRFIVSPERLPIVAGWFSLASAGALLALNYINSAEALPKMLLAPAPLLLGTVALAALLSIVGLVLGWALAAWCRTDGPTRTALMFGLSMKHTGLALILAGTVLVDQPSAILMIVLATLMQHVLASFLQWWGRGGA